jgi:predicted TPR repeat methyltransferase
MTEKTLLQALENDPDNKDHYKNLCNFYAERKNYTALVRVLDQAIERFPRGVFFYKMRASLWVTLKEWRRAGQDFQKNISIDPSDSLAHDSLGVVFQKLGAFKEAYQCHQQAVNLNPSHPGYLFNLAVAAEKNGQEEQAEKIYATLVKHMPDNTAAMINLAVLKEKNGQLDRAEELFKKICEKGQESFVTTMGMASLYRKKHEREKAAFWYEKALLYDPNNETARFMLRHMKDETPANPPKEFVAGLFDDFAHEFDHKLVESLHYRTPEHLYEMLQEYGQNMMPTWKEKGFAVDLGCGTGLFGILLAKAFRRVIGVDLSGKMLEKAKHRGCYDSLVRQDIVTFLQDQAPQTFHLVAAADVFVYSGDLLPVFEQMAHTIRPKGLALFSVEAMDSQESIKHKDKGYVLRETARYAHHYDYLVKLAEQNDFKVCSIDEKPLRLNKGEPIIGYLLALEKQA